MSTLRRNIHGHHRHPHASQGNNNLTKQNKEHFRSGNKLHCQGYITGPIEQDCVWDGYMDVRVFARGVPGNWDNSSHKGNVARPISLPLSTNTTYKCFVVSL